MALTGCGSGEREREELKHIVGSGSGYSVSDGGGCMLDESYVFGWWRVGLDCEPEYRRELVATKSIQPLG